VVVLEGLGDKLVAGAELLLQVVSIAALHFGRGLLVEVDSLENIHMPGLKTAEVDLLDVSLSAADGGVDESVLCFEEAFHELLEFLRSALHE
jgi:hypothetical protein